MTTSRKIKDGWVPEPEDHGKDSTYARGCRCDACREAHATRCREARMRGKDHQKNYIDRRKAERVWDEVEETWVYPDPPRGHGVVGTYTALGCRCSQCRTAMRDYGRSRARRRDSRASSSKRTSVAIDWGTPIEVDTSSVFTWDGPLRSSRD